MSKAVARGQAGPPSPAARGRESAPPRHDPAAHHEGEALPGATRAKAEGGMGVSLSTVRMHRDAHAGAAARRQGARGLSIGDRILVGPQAGEETMLHELVHAAQVRRFGMAGGGVSDPSDPSEQEARRMAPLLARGQRTGPPAARPSAAVQRQDHQTSSSSTATSSREPDYTPADLDTGACVDPTPAPSFRADDVDLDAMANETLNAESVRVDNWLRAHPPGGSAEVDAPEYNRLARRMRAEREKRVYAGHLWMAQTGATNPSVLYQLVGGARATSVIAADLRMALGVPTVGLSNPIMTPEQFQAFLTSHGVEQVAADSDQGRRALAIANGAGAPDVGPAADAAAAPGAATGERNGVTTGGLRSPLLTAPLPAGRAYPFGVAAEGPITAIYYPGAVLAPRSYPAYDAFRGGASTFGTRTEGPRASRFTVVEQSVVGGEWISIKSLLSMDQATPDHIDGVVVSAIDNMANKRGARLDVGEIEPGVRWRLNPADPDSAVVHILVPEEASGRIGALQAAANRAVLNTDFGDSVPGTITARVTPWRSRPPGSPEATPGAARPLVTGVGEVPMAAGASGVIAILVGGTTMLVDARDHPDWASELAAQGGRGVLSGGAQQTVERLVATRGAAILPDLGSSALRVLGRRFGAFGVSAAMESYDVETEPGYHSAAERAVRPARAGAMGLTAGEIGFAAGTASVVPATAGAVFVLSAAGYGAAAGSVAPVVGTAIGFVVGLVVGAVVYAALDAAVPGGREDWDHNAPSVARTGVGTALRGAATRLSEDAHAREGLYTSGSAYAGGIGESAMPPGFGLRRDERDQCLGY